MTGEPSILSCLRETVRRFPNRPAVSDASRTVTYRELWSEAGRYATQLCRQGPAPGMGHLVEARSSVSFVFAVIGTYLADRVFVPFARNAPDGAIRRMADELRMPPCESDLAEILFTTGTTGQTKGVMLSHRAVWAVADSHCRVDQSTEESVCLIATPLDHVGALRKLYSCFLVGAHAVLQDGFIDLKRYYGLIERHRVNMLFLPPSAVQILTCTSGSRLCQLAGQIKEVYSSGSPMTEGVRTSLCKCLPDSRLIFAYGATESSGACCAYDYARIPGKANCVGKASPHAKIEVEDGCLVISGESLMAGYLNDSGRTTEVLHDGRLFTHDLGRIDDEGFVYVIGRADDVINCGGMKVAPVEVEGVAMSWPEIMDCACFGVDDRLTGSAVKLVVVPRDASKFDVVAFRCFLQSRLERHQLPSQIACVADIPRTRNGKTDRKRLV